MISSRFARGQLVHVGVEQVVLQVHLFEQHARVEQVGLIHVDIYRVVALQRGPGDVVLYGRDVMVDKQLLSVHVARKAAHPVIHGDDVRVKAAYQKIQRIERRDDAAGGHVDIHAEGGDARLGMVFRIRMHRNMAFVQMRHNRFAALSEAGYRPLGNKQRGAGPLRLIVLPARCSGPARPPSRLTRSKMSR